MPAALLPAPLTRFRLLRSLGLALGIAALFLLLQPAHARAQNSSCGEPQRSQESIVLERCVKRVFNNNGVEKKVVVYFTTTNGTPADRLAAVDADGNPANGAELSPDAMAGFVADRTVDVWRLYRFYGFPDPQARDDMKVHLFDMRPGLLGWCCTDDEFQVDAPHVLNSLRFGGDPRDLESVVYHEMWHASRWSPAFGCWAIEGGASQMTDHVTQPVDNDATNDYMGRVNAYLNGGHTTSLTDHCYLAALWWQYFSERTSGGTDTLKRGVDSVKAFWDDAAPTDFTRMDNVIRARAPGETFESLWIDFAVANYAKELTGPAGPPKYRYFDETHSLAPDYPAPSFDGSYVITPDQPLIPTLNNVSAWSAKYFMFTPSAGTPLINLEVRQDLNRRLAYSLLFIDNNAIVREQRSIGRNFSVSVPNNGYDQLVLVVVGLNEPAAFRFSFNAAATLEIVDPLWSRPVAVGRPNAPDKFLLKLNLFAGAGGEPMAGIDPNNFAITVGSVPIQPADRISAAFVQGQYWLLLRAPVQPAAGGYDLAVSYAGLNDREPQAVRYVERADAATMVVLDRSGSMNDFAKLQAAKDAARLYIDSWRSNDLIGVASFNEDATVNLPLGAYDTQRNNALNAINGLAGGGDTSIGDGAQVAMQNLIDRDGSARPWSIMLLSDGIENRDITIASFLANYDARTKAKPAQKVPTIIAVALGPDADRARMENLANATGGAYYVAGLPVAAVSGAAAAGPPGALDPASANAARLSNDLAEIYRAGSELLAGQHQIGAQSWPYNYDAIPREFKFQVDGAASEVVFVVKWDVGTLPQDVLLRKPNGQVIVPTPTEEDSLHRLFRIAAPEAGEWTVVIDFANGLQAAGLPLPNELLVEASVSSDLALNAFLGLPVAQRLVGKPMPILATLADARPLAGAIVNAFVTAPAGFYNVRLYDDGRHADGAADDGFYGGTFYATRGHGGYDVVVTASGVGSDGTPFFRRLRLGFNMLQSRYLDLDPNFPGYDPNRPIDWNNPLDPNRGRLDQNGDGLVDWWERETGLDATTPDPGQATADPDYDGLTNGDEFTNGTEPLSSDTDQGGQNDGSELTSGTNPLDPADDQTPCPRFFQASSTLQSQDEPAYTGAVILTYEVVPDHSSFSLWRQVEGGTREFVSDQLPATGVYSDTAVSVGTTYHYWLWANDAAGNASCVLGPATVTLDPNAPAPEGIVRINNGAARTGSPQVTLQIDATADAVEMQVANSVSALDDLTGWEPYATTKAWTLAPANGIGAVFVRFRDSSGNRSEPATALIEIAAGTNLYLPQISRR